MKRKHWRALAVAVAMAGTSVTATQASTAHRKPTSARSRSSAHKGKKSKKQGHVVRGQQAIDSDRATQIQQALIREHYMTGTPTGNWDDASKAAMARYQAANGWQTKVIPDSRALIKLGLGPDAGASTAAASSAAAVPAPVRVPVNPTTPPAPANGKSPTLGSAITAHNNTQNFINPE